MYLILAVDLVQQLLWMKYKHKNDVISFIKKMSASIMPQITEGEGNVAWRMKPSQVVFCDTDLYTPVYRTKDEVQLFGNKQATREL